jgi:hypothetical protein
MKASGYYYKIKTNRADQRNLSNEDSTISELPKNWACERAAHKDGAHSGFAFSGFSVSLRLCGLGRSRSVIIIGQ